MVRVSVKPPTPMSVYNVCANMREIDRREILPLYPDDSAETAAKITYYVLKQGRGGVVWVDGREAAIFGAHPEPAGCYSSQCWRALAFGTDRWKGAAYQVIREMHKLVRDVILEQGTVRLHCTTIEENVEAHKWIVALGGRVEARHPHLGRNGENYLTYVWLRQEQKWVENENWREYAEIAAGKAEAEVIETCVDRAVA